MIKIRRTKQKTMSLAALIAFVLISSAAAKVFEYDAGAQSSCKLSIAKFGTTDKSQKHEIQKP